MSCTEQGRRDQDDAGAVAAVLAGDRERFRVLVERYEGRVYNLVARLVRDQELARDLAQEAFLRAYRGLDTYRPGLPFRSWLFKIAQNCAFGWLRRQGARLEVPDAGSGEGSFLARASRDAPTEAPEAALDQRVEAARLERVVGGLGEAYRATVILRHQEELSLAEIAEVLSVPLGTVKSRLNYAYKLLRQRLAGADGGR